ncbi:hypothetical protein [Lignipirellula cremea]|uniref:Uncharacterized protein n=1 Tax=Lignipirellula cremea TaxID=2528010 RepID=A0A518DSY6_9BACT|nr:hypothetical protein [Lignipirellula cremea]QDU94943.1 hypothetical protein Pla8534_27510 [Lignipirellula cremea]
MSPWLMALLLWQADKPKPGWLKLDRQHQAATLAAFVGLVLLGIGMILLVWLGGRITRRYIQSPTHLPFGRHGDNPDDWAEKAIKQDHLDDE